jgi:hypothetical protein
MVGGTRGLLPIVLAGAVAVAVAATAAHGATATSDVTRLSYRAGGGERNNVVLTWEGATVSVRDPGAALVLGCIPESRNEVRCQAPAGNPLMTFRGCDGCTAIISTGDGDDSAQVLNAPDDGLDVRLDGGAGNDVLSSDAVLGTVLGGRGDDTLTGRDLEGGRGDDRLLGTEDDDDELLGGPGADAVIGNGGVDTASYRDHGEPLRITLDRKPDDGAAGEHDDVRTENVVGGSGDDVLIGDGGANELGSSTGGDDQLHGRGGPDTLIGGPGRDTLEGGAGNDTLLSFSNAPGVIDVVRCGAGEDIAQAARQDHVAPDCEHVYFGGTPIPRLRIGGPVRQRAAHGVLRLGVTARSEEAGAPPAPGVRLPKGPAIAASATLRALRGTPGGVLARIRLPPFAAPGTVPLALRLRRPARHALAHQGAIRMRVTITARDADGNSSITRRILIVRR